MDVKEKVENAYRTSCIKIDLMKGKMLDLSRH